MNPNENDVTVRLSYPSTMALAPETHVPSNNVNIQNKRKIMKKNLHQITSLMVFFTYVLALPVTNVVMGILHNGETESCNSYSNIQFPKWLIINGSTMGGFALYAIVIIASCFTNRAVIHNATKLFLLPAILNILFCFSWLIFGSIVFWKDCDGELESAPIQTLMWSTLIIGFVWSILMPFILKGIHVDMHNTYT